MLAAGPIPVPERLTTAGLFVVFDTTVSLPVRVPRVMGLKLTLMAQLFPAATPDPQLFVCTKSPVVLISSNKVLLPVFVTVTGWLELVEPKAWSGKLRMVGDTVAVAGKNS